MSRPHAHRGVVWRQYIGARVMSPSEFSTPPTRSGRVLGPMIARATGGTHTRISGGAKHIVMEFILLGGTATTAVAWGRKIYKLGPSAKSYGLPVCYPCIYTVVVLYIQLYIRVYTAPVFQNLGNRGLWTARTSTKPDCTGHDQDATGHDRIHHRT